MVGQLRSRRRSRSTSAIVCVSRTVDDVEAHQPADRLRRIGVGLLQQRSTDFAERVAHLPHDVVWQIVGNPREVVGIQRLGDLDEPMVGRFADEPQPHGRVDLENGFCRLPRLERRPDLQAVLRLQPFQQNPRSAGCSPRSLRCSSAAF